MKIVAALLFLIFTSSLCPAAEIVVGSFSTGNLTGWETKPFKGRTVYTLVQDGGKTVLMAHSRHSASGLIRKISLDSRKYPLLRWSWKVSHSLKNEDETKKSGDDFAARVYIVFPRTFFWQTQGNQLCLGIENAEELVRTQSLYRPFHGHSGGVGRCKNWQLGKGGTEYIRRLQTTLR